MFGLFKSARKRREELKNAPFPEAWQAILRRCFPLYDCLAAADRQELEGHIQIFLAEKSFEGCGGLELNDEIRVCVAAQACLLLLHRDTDYYPNLRSILVFPGEYFESAVSHMDDQPDGGGGNDPRRLGESWQHGAVVLAWDSVRHGAANPEDGQNVVLHEFAHQLDQEDGAADGVPVFGGGEAAKVRYGKYTMWARIMSAEFEELCRKAEARRRSVMDQYGTQNPAEFFAVATEAFFEKPRQLRKKRPDLYEQLKEFYRQDPAEWGAKE